MTPFRRRLRKLRFFLQALFVTLVISAAVLVAFAQLALPWLADNPQRIERWLSERLGRPVTIGHVIGTWTQSGPRLIFEDLRIAGSSSTAGALELPRSELALNFYAAFQHNRSWNEFRVVGLDLALSRDESGDWKLRGFDLGDHAGEGASMGALGVVVLVDMQLSVNDPSHDVQLHMRIPELRVVNLGDTTRVLGRLGNGIGTDAPLSLAADIDLTARSGHLYVGGKELDLAQLSSGHAIDGIEVVSANGDLEAWASWNNGQVDDALVKLALDQVSLQADHEIEMDAGGSLRRRSEFEKISLSARWQRKGEGWLFDLANFASTRQGKAGAAGRLIAQTAGGDDNTLRVVANAIDLGTLAPIVMLANATPERLRNWLYRGDPRGSLDAIDLRWKSADDYDVDAEISGLRFHAVDAIAGVDPLAARLRGDAQGLLLEVPDQETRVEFQKVFRKPFELSHFGGDMAAWKDDDGWHMSTHQYRIENSDFAVSLRGGGQLQTGHSRPSMDLAAVVTRGNVASAKLFWPNSMPESTVHWLDRALEVGDIVAGRAIIHGDLESWPFDDNAGRFEARAELSGLKLAYLPDWPAGENLDVDATFINNGMQAEAHSGNSLGIAIEDTDATIADFHEPVLKLSADGHGTGKDLLTFLRATPVGVDHASTLNGLAIGGNGVVHVDLDIPLKHHEQSTLDGKVDLSDADLDESTWDLHFKKANGQVRFDRTGVVADSLATSFGEFPVTLGIAIGSSTSDPANTFEARLDGLLPATAIFSRASDLVPALPRFPGQSEWRIGLDIDANGGPASEHKTLSLSSDLKGIAIDLPAPLQKTADSTLPFLLKVQMPPLGQPFSASLGDIVQIDGRLPSPTSPLSANIELGPTAATTELPARGLRIGGRTKTFDVGGWIGLFSAGGGGGDLLDAIALDVDDLSMAGRHFADLHLDLKPKDDAIKIDVSGPSLEGEISVPSTELRRRGITAQMKRVHWPDLAPSDDHAPSVISSVAPASIPPLHLSIGELKLGATDFGEMRVESYPTDDGMRIDLLETKSSNLDMRASGDWIGSAEDNHSSLAIDMTAESLGKMLDTFGFAGIIEGGQTVAHIDATFPGSPATFALANATGSLSVAVEKGRILDVEPGAGGRLFGLMSLREIPRRLSLDFSDLFKSGMSFNSIKGSFALDNGNAQTDDLHIASPAADITISGRTGLRNKDYDQEMVVTPRAGVALPVVGALAGGPVGAAAGLFVQTLIGKKINRAARSRYRVTGGWDKPAIVLIDREKFDADNADDSLQADAGEGARSDVATALNPAAPSAFTDPVQAVIDGLPGTEQPEAGANRGSTPPTDLKQGSELSPAER